jgi:hypothetical protein
MIIHIGNWLLSFEEVTQQMERALSKRCAIKDSGLPSPACWRWMRG